MMMTTTINKLTLLTWRERRKKEENNLAKEARKPDWYPIPPIWVATKFGAGRLAE
jgi:hypothetical protein